MPLSVSYRDYVDRLLARLAEIVPQGLVVVVVGDRAFGNPVFTDRARLYRTVDEPVRWEVVDNW